MGQLFALFGILLCFSAFFSSCETALFSLSRIQIHRFQQSKGIAARRVVECLRKPRHILVTILLGNELVNIAISVVGASIVSQLFSFSTELETVIAVALVTPILLVFGEVVPKNIAIRLAQQLAPLLVIPLKLFHDLTTPLRWVLSAIADGTIRLFRGKPEASEPMVMEQEFRRLVDLGRAEGVIVEEERKLIHNVFEFTDKVVKHIMTPEGNLFMLPVDLPYEQILERIRETRFSRIPMYEGDRDQVMGILHVRDLFAFDRQRNLGKGQDIRLLLHVPIFIEEHEKIEPLLRKFQEHHVHMAIVVEKKKVVGMATMHDVLEELFGEMKEVESEADEASFSIT